MKTCFATAETIRTIMKFNANVCENIRSSTNNVCVRARDGIIQAPATYVCLLLSELPYDAFMSRTMLA